MSAPLRIPGPAVRFDVLGGAKTFDASDPASVVARLKGAIGKWSRGMSMGWKDRADVEFDAPLLSSLVDTAAKRGLKIAICQDHKSAHVAQTGQAAPSLGYFYALAVVEGGKVVKHWSMDGGAPPDAAALTDGDGLQVRLGEITPLGFDLKEGLANYSFLSPMFVADFVLESGETAPLFLLDFAATDTPYQAGCAIQFNADSATGAGVQTMAGDAWAHPKGIKEGDRLRFLMYPHEPINTYLEGQADFGNVAVLSPQGKKIQFPAEWFWRMVEAGRIEKMSAAPGGNGALKMAVTEIKRSVPGEPVKIVDEYGLWVVRSLLTDAAIAHSTSKPELEEWVKKGGMKMSAMTGAARRFNGGPMNPEQMAAHFGWAEGDDDAAKLAKVMAKMAAPMDPPATMSDPPFGGKETPEEEKAEEEAKQAMSALVGAPVNNFRTFAVHVAAGKVVPVSEVTALRTQVQTMSAAIDAARDEKIADAATAHVTEMIKEGHALEKARDALVKTFSAAAREASKPGATREQINAAGVAAVEPYLAPKGTHTLGARVTAGGNPIGKPAMPVTTFAADSAEAVEAKVAEKAREHVEAEAKAGRKVTMSAAMQHVLRADAALNAQYRALRQ